MDRGRVGEDRGSKETDGCPLTVEEDDDDGDDEGMAEVRAEELWRVENHIKMLQEVADVLCSQT
jgi:hypothetical protein